jgi:putative tryptophan/tyrosine transport system substrate-binding protein
MHPSPWGPPVLLELPGILDAQLTRAAADLVQRHVDVIISNGTIATLAAKNATHTIPIVMVGVADPVASGIVADLRRPGENVTGLSNTAGPLAAKRLQLLKEALPFVKRVGVIWNPASESNVRDLRYLTDSSAALQIQLHPLGVRNVDDLRRAFPLMVSNQLQAFVVVAENLFWVLRKDLLDAALAYRLPGTYPFTGLVRLGGLMAYSWNETELSRRAGYYVGRVLSGANVSELPVEQPTKYEFVINLKTAKALGLTIPPALLLRADQVIE